MLGHQFGFSFRDRAGLVERNGLEFVRVFQVNPALDEDATPGRRSQTTDHRHRRCDHQCTGAGDDQQYQSLVDGIHPRQAHEDRSKRRHKNGHDEHGRGVNGSKPVHELLCGGA